MWIIDSECTDHMTNDDTLFLVEHQLSAGYQMSLAEIGQVIKATKIGFIASSSAVDGREYDCHISDVLFAPGLRHNLLSVSRLENAGFATVFREGGVELWAGDTLFAVGRRRNDLYELKPSKCCGFCGHQRALASTAWAHRHQRYSSDG